MKASELLFKTPIEIDVLKKIPYALEKLAEEFPFEIDTEEETNFYEKILTRESSKELLWYEDDKKAFRLFVWKNEDLEHEYLIHELNILGQYDDGSNDYDGGDPDYIGDVSLREAVEMYLRYIESYTKYRKNNDLYR